MDFILIVRSIYLVWAITILFLNSSPLLRDRLLLYGPRDDSRTDLKRQDSTQNSAPAFYESEDTLLSLLDRLATLQVPHRWFLHFYLASVLSSLFWLAQYLLGSFLISEAALNAEENAYPSMRLSQVCLAWTLMTLQGCRRWYESIAFQKQSQSQMFVGHWILGISFYLITSVAVWVEGAPALRDSRLAAGIEVDLLIQLRFPTPSLKTFIGLPLFVIASGIQHDCHRYLASLKTYTVPHHPAFARLIAPHYLAECLIYLSLAIIAAPTGSAFNRTMISALCFVVANLGVTAGLTRRWYVQKFGYESVAHKWNMVPLLF